LQYYIRGWKTHIRNRKIQTLDFWGNIDSGIPALEYVVFVFSILISLFTSFQKLIFNFQKFQKDYSTLYEVSAPEKYKVGFRNLQHTYVEVLYDFILWNLTANLK